VVLLHPQQGRRSLKYWQANGIGSEKIFSKKIAKSLWDLKLDVTFAPRKTGKVP